MVMVAVPFPPDCEFCLLDDFLSPTCHPPRPSFPPTGAPAEADDWELQRAINQLAELALLGGGHADQLFPDSLDEMYAAALDEAPFRVVL